MTGTDGIDIHSLQSRCLLEEFKGYEILLTSFLDCHSASILIISSRAEMRIINTMAINRLGRLNSSASINSVIAVSALKSIVFTLNIVITLNFMI